MMENFGAKTNFAEKCETEDYPTWPIKDGDQFKMASESHVASEGGADRRVGVH